MKILIERFAYCECIKNNINKYYPQAVIELSAEDEFYVHLQLTLESAYL